MHTHADKIHRNQNQADHTPHGHGQLGFADHRPESIAHGHLQAMADASPQVRQYKALQAMADDSAPQARLAAQWAGLQANPPARVAGLPDTLKHGVESLSGVAMDRVKVHYDSPEPARVNAAAYAQGSDIHLGPGQERHLPHEAWHLVQQAQGKVQPTRQLKGGLAVNDERGLEQEADAMGAMAAGRGRGVPAAHRQLRNQGPEQAGDKQNPAADGVIQRCLTGNPSLDNALYALIFSAILFWLLYSRKAPATAIEQAAKPTSTPSKNPVAIQASKKKARQIQASVIKKLEHDEPLKGQVQESARQGEPEKSVASLAENKGFQAVVDPLIKEEEKEKEDKPVSEIAVEKQTTPPPPPTSQKPVGKLEQESVVEYTTASQIPIVSSKTVAEEPPKARPKPIHKKKQARSKTKSSKEVKKEKEEAEYNEPEVPVRSRPRGWDKALSATKREDFELQDLWGWLQEDKQLWGVFTKDPKAAELGLGLVYGNVTLEKFLRWKQKEDTDTLSAAESFFQFNKELEEKSKEPKAKSSQPIVRNSLTQIERYWPTCSRPFGSGLTLGNLEVASGGGGLMPLLKGISITIDGKSVACHLSLPSDGGNFSEGHLKIEGGEGLNQYFFTMDSNGKARKVSNSPTVPTQNPGEWARLPAGVWASVKALAEHLYSGDLG